MKKRRKKLKTKNFLLFLLLLIFIPTTITIISNNLNKEENTKEEYEETPEVEEYTANLIMVGDALIHNSLYNDANKLANYNGYDFKPHIELIK